MIRMQYRPEMLAWAVYEYRSAPIREFHKPTGEWVEVKQGELIPEPTMLIEDLEEWAKAIRDAGVKLPSDHRLEGVLDAQSKHLEDMRRLVFEPEVTTYREILPNDSSPRSQESRDVK